MWHMFGHRSCFGGIANIGVYCLLFVALPAGALLESNAPAFMAIGLLLLWDLFFWLKDGTFKGRTAASIIDQANSIRTHVSYFLPFYGVGLAILLTLSRQELYRAFYVCFEAGISPRMLLLPFLLATVAVIFLPVQLSDGERGGGILPAVRIMLMSVAFCAQSSIFLLVFIGCRVLMALESTFM